jgi:hypothetical protein
MIFVIAAVIGLSIATLRRVPILVIAERRFRWLGLLLIAAGIHFALSPGVLPANAASRLSEPALPGLPLLGGLSYITSLTFALLFLLANRRQPGFTAILLGLGLNYVVIFLNGGQMPGDPTQVERAGLMASFLKTRDSGIWSPFTLIDERTLLAFLADVIYLPLPFRQPTVASIGDFVIALGVIGFFNPLPRRGGLLGRFERGEGLKYNPE